LVKKTTSIILLCLFPCWIFAGVDFDGTDDFVDGTVSLSGSFSISMWAFIQSFTVGGAVLSGESVTWFMQIGGSNKLQFSNAVGTAPSLNTWIHLAGTFNSSDNNNKLYVDGTNTATVAISIVSTTDFNIGKRGDGVFLNCIVTDVAIWTTVLTDAEISLLADSKIKRIPLQIQSSSLVVYLPLDDEEDGSSSDGDTFRDLSGNGNNGTGDDGANNTGLTAKAEEVLSYPN